MAERITDDSHTRWPPLHSRHRHDRHAVRRKRVRVPAHPLNIKLHLPCQIKGQKGKASSCHLSEWDAAFGDKPSVEAVEDSDGKLLGNRCLLEHRFLRMRSHSDTARLLCSPGDALFSRTHELVGFGAQASQKVDHPGFVSRTNLDSAIKSQLKMWGINVALVRGGLGLHYFCILAPEIFLGRPDCISLA
jgi:hypothetical protein